MQSIKFRGKRVDNGESRTPRLKPGAPSAQGSVAKMLERMGDESVSVRITIERT